MFILANDGSQVLSITFSFFRDNLGRNLEDGTFISFKAENGLDIPVIGILIAPFEIHGHIVEDAHSLVVKDPEDSFMKHRK